MGRSNENVAHFNIFIIKLPSEINLFSARVFLCQQTQHYNKETYYLMNHKLLLKPLSRIALD